MKKPSLPPFDFIKWVKKIHLSKVILPILAVLVIIILLLATLRSVKPIPRGTSGASEPPSLRTGAPLPTPVIPANTSELPYCTDKTVSLVTSAQVLTIPDLAEPQPHTPFNDPLFHTCLVRVTDRNIDIPSSEHPVGLQNESARTQSFNSNSSRLLVHSTDNMWLIYDTASLKVITQLSVQGEIQPRWHAQNPDLIYYFESTRMMSFNVSTKDQRLVHDFAGDFPRVALGRLGLKGGGNPSLDSRYWGLLAENPAGKAIALLVYDLVDNKVIAHRDLPSQSLVDYVSMSPLGNYLVAYYNPECGPKQVGDESHPCGLMVYNRSLDKGNSQARSMGNGDTALDATGREVLVYYDPQASNISMLDLATGAATLLLPIDHSHSTLNFNLSGRSVDRPGWALVSTYNGARSAAYSWITPSWLDDTIFAIELKLNPKVVRLASTQSRYSQEMEVDLNGEPQASSNPDLTRFVFTTNWGRAGTNEVDAYLIVLPSNWTDQLK